MVDGICAGHCLDDERHRYVADDGEQHDEHAAQQPAGLSDDGGQRQRPGADDQIEDEYKADLRCVKRVCVYYFVLGAYFQNVFYTASNKISNV